jgi:probable rRNA maturation factor
VKDKTIKTGKKQKAGAIQITSNQKRVKLDRAGLRRDVRNIFELLGTGQQELSLMIVDDEGIRTINRDYLRRDRPTNVIAFSLTEGDFGDVNPGVLGDVVVSVETAAREARTAGIPIEDAILYLIIHGILHLAGYDHEGPKGIARARIMSAVQEAVFFEIRGYRLDFRL